MVQIIGDVMFRRWVEFIGRTELLDDSRFATDSDRGENGEHLSAIMAEWCAARSSDECLAALAEHRLPACRCLSPAETLQLDVFRDYVEPIPLDEAGKTVPLVTRSVLTAMTGCSTRVPAPCLAVSIEQHVEWTADCIQYMRDNDIATIEAQPGPEQEWFEHVQEVVGNTLYLKANSWYLGANVPGKPRVFIPYLGGAGVYRAKLNEVVENGYRGFTLTPAKVNA